MKASIILCLAISACVRAQTPHDFYGIATSQNLRVTYTNGLSDTFVVPGLLLSAEETQLVPTIRGPANGTETTRYIVVMIDQDFLNEDNTRTTLLHWLQADLIGTPDNLEDVTNGSSLGQVSYVGPAPPLESGVHRYTFVLFEQPSNWIFPATEIDSRIGFDIAAFRADNGLALPLAGNYFTVVNFTGEDIGNISTSTSSSATATSSIALESTAPNGDTSFGTSGGKFVSMIIVVLFAILGF